MKPYLIYLRAIPDCPDKSTKEVVDVARTKAFEAAKKQFKKEIKEITNIKVLKKQPEDSAVAIEIDEKEIETVIEQLTKMDIVATIDSCYDPSIKVAMDISTKEKMEKYLK